MAERESRRCDFWRVSGGPVGYHVCRTPNPRRLRWTRALPDLAEQLITYSVKLQPGEKIYIEIKGLEAMELGKELVRVATVHGGVPFWYYNDETLSRGFINNAGEEQFAAWGQFHKPIMEAVDAYIGVRGSTNPFDLADVDADRMKWHDQAYWGEVHIPIRLKKKWCVLRYPNPSMAQAAERSHRGFRPVLLRCLLP